MPPRVLIVHNIVAPYRLPIFEALSTNYDVTVFFCAEDDPTREWSADLSDYSFGYYILPNVSAGPVRINYTVLSHLRGRRFDAVILSDTPEAIATNTATALYAKSYNIPYIIWTEVTSKTEGQEIHSQNIVSSLKTATFDSYRKILYRYADGFIAYSNAAASYLRYRGISDEKIAESIQVVPAETLPAPPIVDIDGPLVLYVGYLNHRKGVDTLIKAYQKSEITDGKLLIVGTGPEESQLRSLATSDRNIEFTGYVSEEQKAGYYHAADVFVLPTRHDAWGLVTNEAMYYGVPVIVSEAAGSAELVEQHSNGYIVPPGDVKLFKLKLEKLIKNTDKRQEFAQRSRTADEVTDTEVGVKPFYQALSRVLE